MNNTDIIKESILKVILNAIEDEAKNCVWFAEREYAQLNPDLGFAEARYELTKHAKEVIVMSLFGKGQMALIGEFGSGSLMDRNNPALKEYVNGDIFNKERLKYNMAVITRVNDDSYMDLDNRLIERPRPKKEINLEEKNPKKYSPEKPRHILYSIIQERLHHIMSAITLAVAKQVAFSKLFDGRKFKVSI